MHMGNQEALVNKRAAQVKRVCWISLIAIAVSLGPLALSSKWLGVVLLLVTAGMMIFAIWQVNNTSAEKAAGTVITAVTGLMLIYAWFSEGLRDEVLLIFPTLIAYSVLFGSRKVVSYLIVIVLTNVVIMALLVDFAGITFNSPDDGFERAIPILIIFAATGYSIKLLGNDVREANKQLRKAKEDLEIKVVERTRELSDSLEQLKEAQVQLVESEKMASLGKLVAGVAHEINTPLGVSITASSLMDDANKAFKEKIENQGIKRSDLDKFLAGNLETTALLTSNLQRAADLVRDFKSVSVLQSKYQSKQINLREQVQNILESVAPELEALSVKVNTDINSGLNTELDPNILNQVLSKMVLNSLKHAFSDTEKPQITISIEKHKGEFHLVYTDNGSGIPDSIKNQIFEPFSTTKRGQGGTGLGMHVVYNLVTQLLGGRIQALNGHKGGAQFYVQWPATS